MSDRQTILVIMAHPDDEVLGIGATLARYSAAGARTVLVCATRGEVGEIADPALATPETLGAVREGELRCSCQELGIGELIFLDYRDSGMAGTDENRHPSAFMNADFEAVVEKVVRLVRELRPQVMVTFDRGGGYGHPDHIRAHEIATAAFVRAGDPTQFPDSVAGGLHAYSPQHLYYTAIPRSFFQSMFARLKDMGVDLGPFGQIDLEKIGSPDAEITVAIDSGEYVKTKLRAFACHRTQMDPNGVFSRLPEGVRMGFMAREHFVEYGVPATGTLKTDLFSS
ncbi:MAG: PIG-L family deacetylase [Dehalococcoidia bacterium]|nr:PIG-L family deacetylase [Dehalococcoidia bacterium]